MRKVLFLCTGNYYRSRFAEIVFNARATARGLNWQAESRALGIGLRTLSNVGPISPHALKALESRGLQCSSVSRHPIQVCEADLAGSDLIVALKEAEHRPLMEVSYPAWAGRVRYWHIHDLDAATPVEALAATEQAVDELIAQLAAKTDPVDRGGDGEGVTEGEGVCKDTQP